VRQSHFSATVWTGLYSEIIDLFDNYYSVDFYFFCPENIALIPIVTLPLVHVISKADAPGD